jgi:hypothetical protein
MPPSSLDTADLAAPPATRPAARSRRDQGSALLSGESPPLALAVLAGVLLAGCAWLLAAPEHMLSRMMTWDLLFNLEGAWRLQAGHTPHVDFHDPLGSLAFWPTVLGFRLVGPGIFAFIVGEIAVAAVVFAAATTVAARRLPLAPALLFVLGTGLLVLVPTNVGGLVDHFTFAMAYNSIGWAALGVLSLVLFLPPHRSDAVAWPDLLVGGAVLLALFHLKITYFLVAMTLLAVAVPVCAHLRARAAAWAAVAVVAVANALAPHNRPYVHDILDTVRAGAVRSDHDALVVLVTANATELAVAASVLVVTFALWRMGRVPARLPVAVAMLTGGAVAVLSQNAQLRGLPLCGVVLFIVYAELRRALAGQSGAALILLAILALPAAGVASSMASMASYYEAARDTSETFVVDRTNLRDLAVPRHQEDAVANTDVAYMWVNRIRSIGGNVRLSQYLYVQSILEAAGLFADRPDRAGPVLVLDQVSPLSFVLGRPPPRGPALWMDTSFPWQPAEVALGEVRHVLVPKLSTYIDLTHEAVARYDAYLQAHFPLRSESPNWVLLSRAP